MQQDIKPRKIWRIILVSSLALNLLLVGLIGGAYLRGGGAPPRGYDLQLGPLSQALSREDRRKIGDQFRREIGRSGMSRGERREMFENVVSAVEAQPFDPERLTLLITQQQSRTDDVRAAALGTFVAYLSQMSAEQRQSFAQSLREGVQRFREEGGKRSPQSRPSGG